MVQDAPRSQDQVASFDWFAQPVVEPVQVTAPGSRGSTHPIPPTTKRFKKIFAKMRWEH